MYTSTTPTYIGPQKHMDLRSMATNDDETVHKKKLSPQDIAAAQMLKVLLTQAKNERGIKQKDLVEVTGLAPNTISQHKNAINPMSAEAVIKYARFFGVPPSLIDNRLVYLDAQRSGLVLSGDTPATQQSGSRLLKTAIAAPLLVSPDEITKWLDATSDEERESMAAYRDYSLLDESFYKHNAFSICGGITSARPRNIADSDRLVVDPMQRPKGGELGLWLIEGQLEIGSYAVREALYFLSSVGMPPYKLGDWDKRFIGRIFSREIFTPKQIF